MHLQHFALILSFLLSADLVLSDSGSGWTHELAKGYHPTGRDSGALFSRNGAPYLFGGYTEKISFTFDPPQVFFNDLHMYNETAKAWDQIYGATPSVPTERAIFCSAYDPETDSYYVAQGTNYTSDFTQFTYFNDTWKFSFATKTWTRLNSAVVPPGRGGVDCAIQNGNLWMMGGAIFNTSDGNRYVYNDLWKMNLTTGQWTLVRPNTFVNCFADYTACPNPIQRQQHKVLALDDNRRIAIGYGTTFDLSGTNIPLADIWIYDTWTNSYQQLDSLPSSPQPIREFSAWTILPGSTRNKGGIIMFGGDAQGAVNASNNCDPIAICIFPNTPTDQTFYYSFGDQEWSLLPIENTPPLNRKGMITATVPQGRDFHSPLKNAKIWHFGGRTDYVGPANRGTVRYDLLWSLDNLHKY